MCSVVKRTNVFQREKTVNEVKGSEQTESKYFNQESDLIRVVLLKRTNVL